MIHVKNFLEIEHIRDRQHVFVNGDGWDVYQKGDEIPVVPQAPHFPTLTAVQIRLALGGAGLLAAVEAAVDAAGESAQIWWKNTQIFERHHPVLLQMIAALGWSNEQVNTLWSAAASL